MEALDITADIIDVRDIIARIEELEAEDAQDEDETAELATLLAAMTELRGAGGGDEQWRGDWYPITLIDDSYFVDYAEQLAIDIGAIQHGINWPYTCIDWDQAAAELQRDYTAVDIAGYQYWTR